MLNITVAGTTLSTYYLSDPALFLREQRDRAGADTAAAGVRHAKRELRRLIADIDETSTSGETRKRMLTWLACFGWTYTGSLPAIEEPVLGQAHGADGEQAPGLDLVSILITPPGQHLDASPTGRRAGKLRPQRQAEVCARGHQLPAVLLSNGVELRVIRRDPGLGGEASYLSVDLVGLAELGDEHEWRVLWALLRPEAFTPDDAGEILWKRVEDASADAATAVSENLSGGVRTAISSIANGALHHWRIAGQELPAPRALFAEALKVAYRLLFVAYAEDRGLLPVGTPAYDRGYSLRALRKEILTADAAWEPDGGFLWNSLQAQWALLRDGIDAGELQITGFNGGLFDPGKSPLLDSPQMTVGDTFVRNAIHALSWTKPERSKGLDAHDGLRPVNYRELGVEQLGSIYEGLLSFEPQIADAPKALARVGRGQTALVQVLDADRLPENAEVLEPYETGTFYLFEASGQRKGSGSYYTARPLAHFVVGETLRPLVHEATPEQILSLRICDPAMGSGAFLVPAVHQLTEAYGEALSRAGEMLDHKLDDSERAAYRRLIVERCIYGVDLNPMAVELAKVSLWLTTAAAGKPLSFLDAHLRCGNAVVGASIDNWAGVPAPAQGGRVQRGGVGFDEQQGSLFAVEEPDLASLVRVRRALAHDPSEDRLQVRAKEKRFARLLEGDDFTRLQAMGDWWVAPFFYTDGLKSNTGQWLAGHDSIKRGEKPRQDLAELPSRVRSRITPFHWEVEFPEVFFNVQGERRDDAGFDAMIGNPPWEGITFKAAEFYGRFDPTYGLLKGKQDKRDRQVELDRIPEVGVAREAVELALAGTKSFIKESGVYEMLGTKGTYNLYRSFLERELKLLSNNGRIGLVIDSGVVGDAGTQYHRRELFDKCKVDQFVLCDNTNKIFPIDSREQFLLLVAERGGETDPLRFTSGVSRLEHLLELEQRTISISKSTLRAMAPETLAVPDARDVELLDLLSTIYAGRPLLLQPMEIGGWQVDWGRELHIGDNSDKFAVDGPGGALYEGKHFHQFVHRFADPTYGLLVPDGDDILLQRAARRAKLKGNYPSLPRKRGERVLSQDLRSAVIEPPVDHYRPCLRQVASATNERTLIAAVVPPGIAVTESVHFFYRSAMDHLRNGYSTILPSDAMVYIVGLMNSLVLDFVVRRKAGSHVTKSIMASIPVVDVPLDHGPGAAVVKLSARLTCRTQEFDDLADVLGVECAPLSKDEERGLRAELDARVAHLYHLSASQLDLVLADFRQSADSEGSPVRPDETYKQLVREHFCRLAK